MLFPTGGSAYPGECLAILGPSGAGKSTALDILSLRKTSGKITGEVFFSFCYPSDNTPYICTLTLMLVSMYCSGTKRCWHLPGHL